MLDGGPSRIPRPIDRRSARRSEAPRSQADDGLAYDAQPKSDSQPYAPKPRQVPVKKDKPPRKLIKPLLIGLMVLAIGVLGWLAWTNLFGGVASTVDSTKNQAVFLVNGQTYFGKLQIIDDNYLQLSDVFYVRSDEPDSSDEGAETPTSNGMQLVKRGEEVFGPQDPMVLSRDQVVYFENIKDDSQVSELMKEYRSNN